MYICMYMTCVYIYVYMYVRDTLLHMHFFATWQELFFIIDV